MTVSNSPRISTITVNVRCACLTVGSRKALTPFLLQRIFELTGGASLASNIALVENNAAVAAAIAVALSARATE